MSSRRLARACVLQALYQADLTQQPVRVALDQLWTTLADTDDPSVAQPPQSNDRTFAESLALGVQAHLAELDPLIEACSINWRLARMAVVDRAILRLACFELLHHPDTPGPVAANEAVELAKTFGTRESGAFVNGVVDRLARQFDRIPAAGQVALPGTTPEPAS